MCVFLLQAKRLFYNSIMESQKGACYIISNENECVRVVCIFSKTNQSMFHLLHYTELHSERERERESEIENTIPTGTTGGVCTIGYIEEGVLLFWSISLSLTHTQSHTYTQSHTHTHFFYLRSVVWRSKWMDYCQWSMPERKWKLGLEHFFAASGKRNERKKI